VARAQQWRTETPFICLGSRASLLPFLSHQRVLFHSLPVGFRTFLA
jgi:hypothetical protein